MGVPCTIGPESRAPSRIQASKVIFGPPASGVEALNFGFGSTAKPFVFMFTVLWVLLGLRLGSEH